jgi:beta-lactamase superfamily II metal-dependent hydrolase
MNTQRSRFPSVFFLALLLAATPLSFAQGNGKLQIHFMDVGQGDGAVLVSPAGQAVLFDTGVFGKCSKPLSYLQQLGITQVEYVVVSHYHADHIGCVPDVLKEFTLNKQVIDRGGSYDSSSHAVFDAYVAAVGGNRNSVAAMPMDIALDSGTPTPVKISIVAANGDGAATTNENDLSLVAVVHFGNFAAEIGGDLSGVETDNYLDIESSVAPKVGQIDVYKVHHHCSKYSTNETWLSITKPTVGIVSSGVGNRYGHPTRECLDSLHGGGVKTYWTEAGQGALPQPGVDTVGGNIVVETAFNDTNFTVTYAAANGAKVDTFPVHGGSGPLSPGASPAQPTPVTVPASTPKFAWSSKAKFYHYANCAYVGNISATNLQRGNTPPSGKTLHGGCPK